MNKTLFPVDPVVNFETRAEIMRYRGVSIYQNLSDGVQAIEVRTPYLQKREMLVPVSANLMPPVSEHFPRFIEIYPRWFFARIFVRGEERFLTEPEREAIYTAIENLFAERERSLRLDTTEFFFEYYEAGELQRMPIGCTFPELERFLESKKRPRNERDEFTIRQNWDSDIGRLGIEKRFSIKAYEHMPSDRNNMIADFLKNDTRAHYLNALGKSGFLNRQKESAITQL